MDGTGISPAGARSYRSPCERCDRFPADMPGCVKECDEVARFVRGLDNNYVDVRQITKPMEATMKQAVVREIRGAVDQIPRCPKHPDQPQKLAHNGRPMGRCLLCMQEQQKRNALLRRENTKRKMGAETGTPQEDVLDQGLKTASQPSPIELEPPAAALPVTIPKCPRHPENDLLLVTRATGQVGFSNLCRQCMIEMNKKAVKARNEKARTTRLIPKDEAVLAVDLREHPDIMAMLRESMADGMRSSLEVEVIWHLKQRLKNL